MNPDAALQKATEATKQQIDNVGDHASATVDAARNYAKGAVDAAGRKIDSARNGLDRSMDEVRQYIVTQPMQASLISMGIGAALMVFRPWRLLAAAGGAALALHYLGDEARAKRTRAADEPSIYIE
ncbi:MAG: hypothetical protein KKC79_14365 [Gammaproteobacteria bacterium]|nr:hypothetical protein [Gammaproteobacteria bacterium]MBU2409818.1 hypothetical protein [Gammaproteobacteria bacterium]